MAKRQTKKPRPATKGPARRFTDQQVAAALRSTGGIFSLAAAWLTQKTGRPCSRPAIKKYVDRSPELQVLVAEIKEVLLDHDEALLNAHIQNGSEKSLHFRLATIGKTRGYTRRGDPMIEDKPPPAPSLKGLSIESLKQIEAIMLAAQGGEPEG